MSEPEVIARVEGSVGRLTLNRPGALHALNRAMCDAMIGSLLVWRDDPAVDTVLIDHRGERGFCAGGDVRAAAADAKYARAFFRAEYQLNALLFRYPKPVVAVMDGVTMGGGVGLARPARFRIATDRTVFAMPEGAIGLFPDVGAGWWLPRLPGRVGLWLAMTGARLGPADCVLLGLATDYVRGARVEALKADLIAAPERFEERLTEFEDDPGEPPIAAVRDDIDRLFGHSSVEMIVEALRDDGSEWALAQLAAVLAASPTTLKAAFRQLRIGGELERFEDEMAVEFRMATRIAASHDFREGVRAVLVDKTGAPAWDPPSLEAVDAGRLDKLFAPLSKKEEWRPIG
jgi:enoyl-CoA hydratase